MPSGGKAKNPTAILNNTKFESMLLALRDSYDKIIIDSPPLAAVSDSLNIVPLVDAIIYVIKYDSVKNPWQIHVLDAYGNLKSLF